MADYSKKPQVLTRRGMNITLPGDRLTQEWFQYLQNVRSYLIGEWRQRPGMGSLYSTPDAGSVYFLGRINNNQNSTFRRLIGTSNGNVYVDDPTHSFLNPAASDTGYSGKRYSSIISRPDRSPNPFLFLASDVRNGKFSTTGVRSEWGISAPTSAPIVEPQGVNYRSIADLTSTAGWSLSGGSSLVSNTTSENILGVLYDFGSTGMASIALSSSAPLTGPMATAILRFTNSLAQVEDCMVMEQIPPISPILGFTGATIADISYDSGSTGLCTIQFTGLGSGLKRNAMLLLDNGGPTFEFIRVLSVTTSIDGIPSIRCSTINTHTVGQLVNGAQAIRVFTTNTQSTSSTYLQSRFTVNLGASFVPTSIISTNLNFANLTQAPISSGGSPSSRLVKADDFLNFSVIDDFGVLDEIQIQFDTLGTSFTQDYFYVSIRSSDLAGSYFLSTQSITAQQLQLNRQQLDQTITDNNEKKLFPPSIGDLGDISTTPDATTNQFFGSSTSISTDQGPVTTAPTSKIGRADFQIPISQFQHVEGGSKGSLQNISGARIVFKYNALSSIVLGPEVTAFNIGGTYEPNTKDLPLYTYVYRGRNTSTGSRSNPSPPTRSPIESIRRRTVVTVAPHPDPQVDAIDIFRIGGTLTNYYLVGTLTNGATTFEDNTPDSVAIRNPQLEVDRFKPWVTSDIPKSGTCTVHGTSILYASGDLFNTGWVRGTQIIINGKVFTLYSNPQSAILLELNESAGFGGNLPFQLTEPVLDGQTYQSVFGPYVGAAGEFLFAVGDPRNPGWLYWTNGNDPESTSDVNFIELCPPSETLMNGIVLDGIVYCFSDKRSWRILPSFQGGQSGGGSDFYPQETAMGKGLIGRFAIAVGDAIYFVSFDGIYRSRGDVLDSLTDESIAPLFRRDGSNTTFTAPVSPVDFTFPDEITLTYSFDGLYLSYRGQDTNRYTFYMSFLTKGWVLDTIGGDSIIKSSREIRTVDADNVLVGTTNGNVLIRSTGQFLDNGQAISCRIWDREEIWEDQGLRITKQVGDLMVDSNPNGATLVPTLRYENNTSNDVLANITGSVRGQTVLDINSGSGRIVRGAALDLTWNNGTSAFPQVYAWEPWALIKPDKSLSRASDWDNGGYPGTKWLQGFRFKGDSFGQTKTFSVEIDGGTFVQSFTFNSSGEQVQTFWLTNPVVAHEFRIRGTDSTIWRNYYVEWIFEPEPELAAVWETQVTSMDMPFYHHIREMGIAHRSTADITMSVITDNVTNNYPIINSGGVRSKTYLPVLSLKAKLHKFRFTSSAPFGLWIRDIEVKVGPWGRTDMYRTVKPFGDLSRMNGGARV